MGDLTRDVKEQTVSYPALNAASDTWFVLCKAVERIGDVALSNLINPKLQETQAQRQSAVCRLLTALKGTSEIVFDDLDDFFKVRQLAMNFAVMMAIHESGRPLTTVEWRMVQVAINDENAGYYNGNALQADEFWDRLQGDNVVLIAM